jgi:hypothetical protein
MAYLTELPQTYSIPQDFAGKPATPGTTNCPPAQQKGKCDTFAHENVPHAHSFIQLTTHGLHCCTVSNFGKSTT